MAIKPTVVRTAVVATILLVSFSLAGCVPAAMPPIPGSPSPSPTPTPSALASPSPAAQPEDAAVPVTIPCESVISAQQMYDFSPTFVLLSDFVPRANSMAALAVEHDGTICRWVNETSSAAIDISIAQPASADFQSILASAASGTAVSDVGDQAYFAVLDGIGTTQVFNGAHWVTAVSTYFSAPDDALPLLEKILSAIR